MRLTIKSNGEINNVDIERFLSKDGVASIKIDFTPPQLWSDFELWLEDESGSLVDYKKINLSKRNKMQMSA